MTRHYNIPAVLAAALVLFSCTPEPASPVAVPPESYLALVDAYNSDKQYCGISYLSSTAKVFFLGSYVMVPNSEMLIDDCRDGAEPDEAFFDEELGYWNVGGETTSLVRSNGTLRESFPVYSWADRKGLYVLASNGETFSFDDISYREPEDGPDNPDTPEEPDTPVPPTAKYEIPRVYITTDNGRTPSNKTEYIPGTIRVEDPSCTFAQETVFEARMGIRGRGNTTWGMPKKPYKVKLDAKAGILGMPKDREWVLLANYDDKSLLRNIVAMEISRRLGFSWTPGMVSVELWFNGAYQGVYTFSEHKKVSPYRVNIEVATAENNSGDGLTGGFYLEFENESINEPCWVKSERYGVTLMYHEPEYPTEEQQAWFRNYLNAFESTLYALGHDDRGEKNYYDYIDVDSFINYYILEELAKDPDANFRKSTYIAKERGKKMELYHVWDFDITFGNCNYWGNGLIPENFVLKDCVWYNRLFNKDRDWVDAVVRRWDEVYDELNTIPQYIDEQVRLLDGAQDRNFERWDILGKYVWPNAVWYDSYEEEIQYLKDFYGERLMWMDEALRKL